MNKRGISPVIATILLILIVVALVPLIWTAVKYFLVVKPAGENICQKADIFISPSDVCYDSAKKITSVGITKGSNDIDIVRLQFVFSYEQADQSNIQEVAFNANSKKLMYFDMSGIYNGKKPVKVKIIPIVKLADGNEKICEEKSEARVEDCNLKQEVGGYDGWMGCTTDQECIEKAGSNPNNISMTCVQILAFKRGICCFRGMCSGGPGDRGNTAGGTDTPVGAVPKGCVINCVGKQCGPDGCGGVCGSCAQYKQCYQESANVPNQGAQFGNSDGGVECGLDYSGNYFAETNFIYINYTKPAGALADSTLKIKYGTLEEQNILVSPCWNADANVLSFRIESNSNNGIGNSTINISCYNGQFWEELGEDRGVEGENSFQTGEDWTGGIDGNWTSFTASVVNSNINARRWQNNLILQHRVQYPTWQLLKWGGESSRFFEEAMIWKISRQEVCISGQCCAPKSCENLGKNCDSWDDGCGSIINCGTCSGYCDNGNCWESPQCTPDCTGKQCGDDGCGGLCPPECETNQQCHNGQCIDCGICPPANSVECGKPITNDCGNVCSQGTYCRPGTTCKETTHHFWNCQTY